MGWGALIAGIIAGGASLYGSSQASKASKKNAETLAGASVGGDFGIPGLGSEYRLGGMFGLAGLQNLVAGGDITKYFPESSGRSMEDIDAEILTIQKKINNARTGLNIEQQQQAARGGSNQDRTRNMKMFKNAMTKNQQLLTALEQEKAGAVITNRAKELGGIDLSKPELGQTFKFQAGELSNANDAYFAKMGMSASGAKGAAYAKGYGNLLTNETPNDFNRKYQTLSTLAGYGATTTNTIIPSLASLYGEQSKAQTSAYTNAAGALNDAAMYRASGISNAGSMLGEGIGDYVNKYLKDKQSANQTKV